MRMLISGLSPAKELGTRASQKISWYNRIRVDRWKRFEYAACERENFRIRKKMFAEKKNFRIRVDMALKSLDFRLSVDTIQEKFHSEVIKWLLNETIQRSFIS